MKGVYIWKLFSQANVKYNIVSILGVKLRNNDNNALYYEMKNLCLQLNKI